MGNNIDPLEDVKRRPLQGQYLSNFFFIQSEFSRNPWNIKYNVCAQKILLFSLKGKFCLKSKIFEYIYGQDWQSTYNVTLSSVRATTVAVEKQ